MQKPTAAGRTEGQPHIFLRTMGKGAMGKGAQQHALVDANGATRTKANKCTPAKGSAPAADNTKEVAVAPTVCAACGKEGSSSFS